MSKQNYKGRNTRRPRSKKDEESKAVRTDKVAEQKYNDASWYNAHDQLMKDVASLSFNTPLGNTRWISADGITGAGQYGLSLPGIMSIYTVPAVTPSNDATSAVNIAAKTLYSYVRHENSGHANYESADLMLYILAMDSVYSMISWMQNIYGTAMVFSQTNRYLGDALITAKGARASDIRNNLANFRTFINQYIVKASAFCVPNTMSLFKRHFWMFSNSFKDEPVTKSQLYTYVPAYLWQYNIDGQGAGFLDPLEICCAKGATVIEARNISLAEIMSCANALLEQLQYSEDINIMSGDILKAYGRENLWTMDLIPSDYGVFPVYSEEILDQLHNTVFAGYCPIVTASGDVTADTLKVTQRVGVGDGALLFNPKFRYGTHMGWEQVLDIHTEAPTPEEVMVSTRNMLTADVTQADGRRAATLTSCGSDICLFGSIYLYQNGSLNAIPVYMCDDDTAPDMATVGALSKFNKYPRYYYWTQRSLTDVTLAPEALNGEIDNYTIMSKEDIAKLHDTAMLNLLGVPTLGLVG